MKLCKFFATVDHDPIPSLSSVVPSSARSKTQPEAHVASATWIIAGMALAMALVLEAGGVLRHTDHAIARIVSRGGAETFPNSLSPWLPWLAAALFVLGLTHAIFHTDGTAKRVMLWLTAMVLVGAWAPVLSLCAYKPTISAVWIATAWSGVCAIVYASRHHMPCDEPSKKP